MKTIEYNDMDLTYVSLYAAYHTTKGKNKNKTAVVKDIEKLAEMGHLDAQALWYKVCDKQRNIRIDAIVDGYDEDDYRKIYAKACKAYYTEEKMQHIVLKTKLNGEDNVDRRTVINSEIMDLKSRDYLIKAINKCREKIESGKATLLDKERRFEMIRKSPFEIAEDVEKYSLGSKPFVLYNENKSDPIAAHIFASNYTTKNPNHKNEIVNSIFSRLAGCKLAKDFLEYRGPNPTTPLIPQA